MLRHATSWQIIFPCLKIQVLKTTEIILANRDLYQDRMISKILPPPGHLFSPVRIFNSMVDRKFSCKLKFVIGSYGIHRGGTCRCGNLPPHIQLSGTKLLSVKLSFLNLY